MSRRKAFDTSLSGGKGKGPQPKTNTAHVARAVAEVAPTVTETTKAVDGTATPPENDDADTCFICAEPIKYYAVGQCGHRMCHVCAIRLRVFYKRIECTFCKTLLPSLQFSQSPDATLPDGPWRKPSSDAALEKAQADAEKPENKGKKWYQGLVLPGTLDVKDFPYADEKLGVVFEDEEMMEQCLLLLRFNCPYTTCSHMSNGWPALEKHTVAEHGLVLCKICTRQLSRFSHEQTLYPPHLLGLHDPSRLQRGQKPPRPRTDEEREMVASWDAPHPMCEFCHEGFFGPDELFKHMRDKHEECFVCRQLGDRDVYFQNYVKLENHFNRDHFPCPNPVCIEKKFQVFGSELDLRAHQMEEHGEAMSQKDRAQARQLHIDFSSRPESGPSRTGGRGGRGFSLANANNGRDGPQTQQIAPPPMNAAQAEQQRRQIQTDRQEEGRRRKAFNTGLTGSNGATPSGSAGPSGRQTPVEPASGTVTPRDDVDEATQSRHAALITRVSMLVNDSQTKMASFRSAIRQYKNNESGVKDMLDTVYHVLDEDADSTAGVLREVANLFNGDGEKDKQKAILEAVNAFRVQQAEQFPQLGGGTATGSSGNWAGVSSGRVLAAKRATHTGFGRGNSRAVWDRVAAAAEAEPVNRPRATAGLNGRFVPGAGGRPQSPSAFPALGGAAGASRPVHSTPWASGGGGGSSSRQPTALVPQVRSVNFPVATANKPKGLGKDSFPGLPSSSAAKSKAEERAALFSKPTARDESIARIRGTPVARPTTPNSWGGGASDAADGVAELSVSDEPQTGGKKKGKGKQKQLLFSVSARP
ncbi:hypothetical protein Q8F55_007496 [Vanrija albida]|uniref:RING-type E3 ubiquitin transferase n=1 Tax=Vanrija albida TaxID=181172 RepID=A0ABR3PTQ9_9TREE